MPDGQPIVVSLAPAAPFTVGEIPSQVWTHPVVNDPMWRLSFEGFMSLPALAERAAQDGQRASIATMVAQVAAFHEQNRDPGTSAFGWDEGTAQRRLQAENCLYALTGDDRLVPGMQADVDVQLGTRYYGPPLFSVHNHGLMANLRLVRAGQLLNRPMWVSNALGRMRSEASLAFSPQGTSWEQSSGYQQFNVSLWNAAADQLGSVPAYASTAAAIRAITARGRQVAG